ncbi:MAG: hypothetical protein B6240_01940 [Desulfobacteraceae bacterium 4572_87]|nr:MAG: hypothetical protein B6240_01940 [Desulfobacteraceae bacterium 4572_87]
MQTGFDFKMPFQGLLDDNAISFNIRRSSENRHKFPRKVLLLHSSSFQKSVIPGVSEKKERPLCEELKQYQNWRKVTDHSIVITPCRFSFLWRFRTSPETGLKPFKSLEPVDSKGAKQIKGALKRFRAHLTNSLKPGRIYLIPDGEVTFNHQNRIAQGYARRVLVANVTHGQILLIPFSTKISRINKHTDILFDPEYKGKALDPEGFPAVDSFPDKQFSRKTALVVCAAQPMDREAFLEGALLPMGVVRHELLNFVKEKLKNL